MKKIICLITITLMGVVAFAQTVTLTFTGRDAAEHWIQLNRVAITNLTKSWQETIYWPDTTLTMQNGTGIDESVANGGFALSQNNPNPFSGTTDVNLTVADAGAVTLEIVDGNGKTVGTHRVRPEIGTHQFRVSLSAAGTYVMTARQNGKSSSIKMVCNGGGNANGIDYLGMVQTITFVLKSTTNNPFNFGDMMEYVGYATINGTEMESQRITQAQGTSQTFVLQFDAIQLYVPVVSTDTISDVTTTSAICGGNVTNDGGAAVISRGICFNTTGTPTVNDDQTTDGDGLGSFVSLLDGLMPYTQYYVRAYATNSVGTAYGEERSFTTLCDLPEVTTTQPVDVTTTSFTCGGDVVAINCDELTARGLCWNTTVNPTVADNHTTEGTTAGSFTSSVTGLECGTTYFVRAYATNAVGTSYGEEYEVTTLAPTLPDVATLSVILYNGLNMIVTSEVTSENCEAVSSRGICYSTSPNPTISDSHTTHAIGLGILNDTITELDTGTTYYVRAYATNSLGTAYGEELSVTTPTLPTVTTASVSSITATTATTGGNVTDDGGATVTACGVCWSTDSIPTMSDSHSIDGNGIGSFTSSITGLAMGTTYFIRAYATNSVGTAYGEEVSFTTHLLGDGDPCPGTPTLTDASGNTYNTIWLGTQCWMKENLRTTTYANGNPISQGSDTSTTTAYWYYPNNSSSNMPTYGLLYNWAAVMHNDTSSNSNPSGVQGICPDGWHVPSEAEWEQLAYYVRSQSQYVCGVDNTNIAKALASTMGWNSENITCAVGNIPADNNATGFSALPAGHYVRPGSSYSSYFGDEAYFWSATEENHPYHILLRSFKADVYSSSNAFRRSGFSVRCVRDEMQSGGAETTIPTVSTVAVGDITSTTATSGGNVTDDGGAPVTARGICWSTNPNPTISDSHTTEGNGTSSFPSTLTGLTLGTTYYVRAYATNSVGTAYGSDVSFITPVLDGEPCPGTPTITDIDGNIYNAVMIGAQCWMMENLRTTKYADGTSIYQGSSTSSTTAYWYYPGANSSNKPTYGLLYNWKAVMRDAVSSSANPSGVQGICPDGWHVPSDAEWKQMEVEVGMSQSEADNTGWRGSIAARLCGNTGWTSSSTANAAGNTLSTGRNSSGFSALPAGYYTGSYYSFGEQVRFWSATENYSGNAYSHDLSYSQSAVYRYYYSNEHTGLSVRCVRDIGTISQTVPIVITSSVSSIDGTSANCGGNVTSNGLTAVTARGVCWSTSHNPTVSDSHTTDGEGTGIFTSNLTALTPNTTYYVRAYATNSVGTAYGSEVSFTTTNPCPGTPTLVDIDGNIYNTVIIGSQCWMKENLRTTRYADSTTIAQGSETSTTTAYWYSSSSVSTYNLLYNWAAVMGSSSSSGGNPSRVQGICPTGWHVPRDAEWTQLTDYVSSQSQYVCDSTSTKIAKALASTTGWSSSTNTCAVGNTPSNNNATGFSARPSGAYDGNYYSSSSTAYFWTATAYNGTYAYRRRLNYSNSEVLGGYDSKYEGYSVRCVRDEPELPTVTTAAMCDVTSTTANCGGNVTSDGGATVTARGVCWSTSSNPTISDSHTTDGNGTGDFTSSLTGLTANTTYYVRAYATNSVGTAYGSEVSFTASIPNDGQPCSGTPTVTDIDGNTYNTVQIGQQCWMKENLRTTKYADNTSIEQGSSASSTTAYWYYPNNDASNMPTYGLLYNWKAVMYNSSSSLANPSGVQGICPTGWHVPSDAEWTQLTDYVSSLCQYVCGDTRTQIAKALASTTGWSSCSTTCCVGNTPSNNNATGFCALPARNYNGSFYNVGDCAFFWSTSKYTGNAFVRRLSSYSADVYRTSVNVNNGHSVRCVKD